MKLIVGLGNPGREYRETRHNVGFMVVDEMVRRASLQWAMAPSQVPDAFVAKRFGTPAGGVGTPAGGVGTPAGGVGTPAGGAGTVPVLLAKPLTFMNRSGDVVAGLSHYYDIAPEDLLVVVDEAALPLGRLRARAAGSSGGHNGLKSIVERLGTTDFPRLRLGVGRGDARRDLADHVLSAFERGERAELESLITRAADAAEMFAAEGILKVMNVYNPGDAASETTD